VQGIQLLRECFKRAFKKCSPILLEPIMSLEINTPEENVGSIVGSICSKRGKVSGIETGDTLHTISAEAPLSELFGFASLLRNSSSGRANYSMHFERYSATTDEITTKIMDEQKHLS